ncbi:lymphocyte function-associated antigen 3-like isoform 2-T2 [Fundulus diaphanus]
MMFTPMKTPVGPAAWFVVLLVACEAADETIYAKLGDEVTLKPKPGSVTNATKSITWKVGGDLAMELDEGFLISYRHFKERGHLNNRTGEMTITGLTYEDTQVYTTEIDGAVINHNIHLHVISPVPVPTITSSCSLDASTCTLTCEGDTTRAGPVTFTWMFDSVVVPHDTDTYIIKEDSSAVKEFKCKMKNPVSEETSKTFFNLLEHDSVKSGPKISAGVTVFVILLVAVVLLALVHRLKTGEFFFNKSSYPWQGDFWRNTKGHIPVDSNGSTSPPPKGQDEEDSLKA